MFFLLAPFCGCGIPQTKTKHSFREIFGEEFSVEVFFRDLWHQTSPREHHLSPCRLGDFVCPCACEGSWWPWRRPVWYDRRRGWCEKRWAPWGPYFYFKGRNIRCHRALVHQFLYINKILHVIIYTSRVPETDRSINIATEHRPSPKKKGLSSNHQFQVWTVSLTEGTNREFSTELWDYRGG